MAGEQSRLDGRYGSKIGLNFSIGCRSSEMDAAIFLHLQIVTSAAASAVTEPRHPTGSSQSIAYAPLASSAGPINHTHASRSNPFTGLFSAKEFS